MKTLGLSSRTSRILPVLAILVESGLVYLVIQVSRVSCSLICQTRKFLQSRQIVFLVLTAYQSVFDFEAYAFEAVFLSLSVSVDRIEESHLIYIFFVLGNVSDCSDAPDRNSAFDDGYL